MSDDRVGQVIENCEDEFGPEDAALLRGLVAEVERLRRVNVTDVENIKRRRDEAYRFSARMEKRAEKAEDLCYTAWTILANVSEGDWTRQTQEWQDAVVRWRYEWHESRPPLTGTDREETP